MYAWPLYVLGLVFGLVALAAVMACVLSAAYDRASEELAGLAPDDLLADRQAAKSQLIVDAMKRDRDAAFAAWTGTPFGDVPRVPKEGA